MIGHCSNDVTHEPSAHRAGAEAVQLNGVNLGHNKDEVAQKPLVHLYGAVDGQALADAEPGSPATH